MTDHELLIYLGIAGTKDCERIMAAITTAQRETFEQMAAVELAIKLWEAGQGPKPRGVIVCRRHRR